MAHFLFNLVQGDEASGTSPHELAAASVAVRMWGVGAGEPHHDALAPGDAVLLYLGAPDRVFIGRAELASAVHDWTSSQAQEYPADVPGGVLLTHVEEWDPPVPIGVVLAEIGPSESTGADFEHGVVAITDGEYEAALTVAGSR